LIDPDSIIPGICGSKSLFMKIPLSKCWPDSKTSYTYLMKVKWTFCILVVTIPGNFYKTISPK